MGFGYFFGGLGLAARFPGEVFLPFTVPASYSLSFISPPYWAFEEETLLFLWPSSAPSKMSWLNLCDMTASCGPVLTTANSFSSQQVIIKQEL